MPTKAKRPCRYNNCPALTDSPSGYCKEHEKLIESNYNRYIRTLEAKRRYGYRWRKLRTAFISANPLCEMCKRQGRYTAATEVHHVKPLADGGTNDIDNLMALCRSCHARVHLQMHPPTPCKISEAQSADSTPLTLHKKF